MGWYFLFGGLAVGITWGVWDLWWLTNYGRPPGLPVTHSWRDVVGIVGWLTFIASAVYLLATTA